jgi:hypothetical protein
MIRMLATLTIRLLGGSLDAIADSASLTVNEASSLDQVAACLRWNNRALKPPNPLRKLNSKADASVNFMSRNLVVSVRQRSVDARIMVALYPSLQAMI